MKTRIVLAGGSGFLGRSLATTLSSRDYEVLVLSRAPAPSQTPVRFVCWDGRTIGKWVELIDGAKAIVNFTGKSVNCCYSSSNRREIINSRVNSVRVLGEAISQCAQPPEAFVQAGSLAIYGNTGDRWCDEAATPGRGFGADVCRVWEQALAEIDAPATRKSILRIGFALGPGGGVLAFLARLTRWFLGGQVGSGRQFVSWIHAADLNRMFLWAIERGDIGGVFNASSPNPVTNAELMRELRRALHRPWSPPVPAMISHIGAWILGTEASLALTGRRCIPKRFLEKGFQFEFPDLRPALANIYP
jgi:uncharacterized protein (TIGR01777 family)